MSLRTSASSTPSMSRCSRSIALQGILVPLVVCPSGEAGGFELVAGFHRIAAAARLGLTEVPVIVRG